MPFISSVRKQFGPQGKKNTRWRRYPFTTHTFTPAGASGRYGPSLAQVQASYAATGWASNTSNINVANNGVQFWAVPAAGTYRITCAGAGNPTGGAGRGARMIGDFTLLAGQTLRILVGQQGLRGSNDQYVGGSGGSTVSIVETGTLLIAAGGGAGVSNNSNGDNSYRNARTGNNSTDNGVYGWSTYRWNGSSSGNWDGGGGGSWGANADSTYNSRAGLGGSDLAGSNPIGGIQGDGRGGDGGFGGGGGTGVDSGAAGAGGGYRGGCAAYSQYSTYIDGNNGTGGGSYNIGANQQNFVDNHAQGYVTITRI